MPAPYRLEFRQEAVELLKRSGKSVPQLAAELGARTGQLLDQLLLRMKTAWQISLCAQPVGAFSSKRSNLGLLQATPDH
jgi:hypothetical protein